MGRSKSAREWERSEGAIGTPLARKALDDSEVVNAPPPVLLRGTYVHRDEEPSRRRRAIERRDRGRVRTCWRERSACSLWGDAAGPHHLADGRIGRLRT
jgi:hypothetical protein